MPYITDAKRREVFSALSLKAATNFEEIKVKTEKNDEAPGSSSTFNKDLDPPLPDVQLADSNKETTGTGNILSCDSSEEPDHPPEKKRKSSTFTDLFGEIFVTKVEQATPLEVRIDKEITNYKSECSISLESDPLQWWKNNESKYPLLSSLARKYLCTPATSVASERIFSTAGDLVTAQRSCLSPEQVNRLIFLKKNMN